MTGSTEAHLYVSNVERRWAWVRECKTSHRTTSNHTRIGADPGDAEERRATKPRAARPGRAPQDHHGVRAMLNTTTRVQKGKGKHREAKRRTKKIKARAYREIQAREWRNTSKRWRKDKDQTQEINSKWKDKARTRLTTTKESLRFRAETEHDNQCNKNPFRTVTTDRLQAGEMESVLRTNPDRGRHH